jgi:hypothetical protein
MKVQGSELGRGRFLAASAASQDGDAVQEVGRADIDHHRARKGNHTGQGVLAVEVERLRKLDQVGEVNSLDGDGARDPAGNFPLRGRSSAVPDYQDLPFTPKRSGTTRSDLAAAVLRRSIELNPFDLWRSDPEVDWLVREQPPPYI